MYRSEIQYVGDMNMPDYVYYNADIINNETADQINGATIVDPQIRFNETRDKAIVRDASQYYFSIVRFTMNGANQDLPLFIPTIQQGTGQSNVNLTSYSLALSYQQSWNISYGTGSNATVTFDLTPRSRFVQYESETQNADYAPVPKSTANVNFTGLYVGTTNYSIGSIVGSGIDIISGASSGPFFQVRTPDVWDPAKVYPVGTWISYQRIGYYAVAPVAGVPPSNGGSGWVKGLIGIPPSNKVYWEGVGPDLGQPQDLSTRYYWVYTYQHWLDLINKTLWDPANSASGPSANGGSCLGDLFNAFVLAWNQQVLIPYGVACPYATQGDFATDYLAPNIQYSPSTKRFSILADSDSYGERLTTFTPDYLATAPVTSPVMRLFMNTNLFGLFAGFPNIYWNTFSSTSGPFPGIVAPEGYVNEILFSNKFYQNVRDLRVPPSAGIAPLGFVPVALQKVFWVAEQDYGSTDSLWSPIGSLVFTSALLPVQSEFTGQPVTLGTGNLGSQPTTQSAFQPIITDIALDTASSGAEGYRQFVYYSPTAEYRLSDFTNSRQEIRQIDVQVFWKNRLNNQLYPITMFNLSSVSLKMMFRKK